MKTQNLGKKILLMLLLLFGYTNLLADATLTVQSPAIYKGDTVSFTITAKGNDVKFPDIKEVNGFNIISKSSSNSTSIINGVISKKVAQTYMFIPTSNITIPPYSVQIDGKNYQTNPQTISVLKPSASKNGEDFVLELNSDKSNVNVGENIKLSVIFKHKIDAKLDKLNLEELKLDNFWIKQVGEIEKSAKGQYIIQTVNYLLFPQKAGDYTISSLQANVGTIANKKFRNSFFDDPFFDTFTNQIKWKKIYSNQLQIKVKSLPNNLEIFGNYKIKTQVDKTKVKANEPVNLTITIKGVGNIEDIKKFNLEIQNGVTYTDEPNIKESFINNQYGGTFTQKIAIVAQKDYTIEPFRLRYFDKKENKEKTISSKPIKIEVSVDSTIQKPHIETIDSKLAVAKQNSSNTTNFIEKNIGYVKYITLILGLILVVILAIIITKRKNKNSTKENDMIKAIKRAKKDKELFELLLPYSKKDKIISEILAQLEDNIYNNAKHKIAKQKLYEIF